MSRLIACACAILAAVAVASPGNAQSPAEKSHQLVVSFSDLDLSRTAGVETLLSRLSAASRQVCGGEPDVRDLAGRSDFKRCFTDAMDHAVAAVHVPAVVALYNGTPAGTEPSLQNLAANAN